MTHLSRGTLPIAIIALALTLLTSPTLAKATAKKAPPSEIRMLNGVPTFFSGGKPFLIAGAQCDIWRSGHQDAKTVAFFDGFSKMSATVVSVGIPWAMTEPAKDRYDFTFMDWFIRQAEIHRLKLILNLFDTNVCGKVEEAAANGFYPQYAPSYLLDDPKTYQRMVLTGPSSYVAGGPPMCPNDPETLDRERRYVVRVAEHLERTDKRRTVLMLQVDNEFYYQQWEGERPADERAVRCHCPYCERKFAAGHYSSGEDFMFHSFADYAKVLTDSLKAVYDIPLYLNSPWWNPADIPIFLERCPNLNLVGIDGIFDPNEPNMLSQSQVSRNLPFAAENPTEQPKTRLNLDALPYYTLVGRMGIGNLLWECGPPHTVVDDPAARKRYGDALYPLKNAMEPILRSRGTDAFAGWYALRETSEGLRTDVFGNYLKGEGAPVVKRTRFFLREGKGSRIVENGDFTLDLGPAKLTVSDSSAGVAFHDGKSAWTIATPGGSFRITGPSNLIAEEGIYLGSRWKAVKKTTLKRDGDAYVLSVTEPKVIRFSLEAKRPSKP